MDKEMVHNMEEIRVANQTMNQTLSITIKLMTMLNWTHSEFLDLLEDISQVIQTQILNNQEIYSEKFWMRLKELIWLTTSLELWKEPIEIFKKDNLKSGTNVTQNMDKELLRD